MIAGAAPGRRGRRLDRWSLLKAGVSLGLLGWFLRSLGSRGLVDALRQANPMSLILAGLLGVLMVVSMAYRWKRLLQAAGLDLPFLEVSRATFVGYYFGFFLPSVGGDVVRGSWLARRDRRVLEIAVSIFVDRWLGLAALLPLGAVALAVLGPGGVMAHALSGAYAVTLAALLLAGTGGLAGRLVARWLAPLSRGPLRGLPLLLQRSRDAIGLYARRKLVLLQALAIGVLSQGLSVLVYHALAVGMGAGGTLVALLCGVPAVTLATTLPISVGGIGVGEWAFVQVLTGLGMPRDDALAVSVLNLLVRIGIGLIGGLWYSLADRR